jgi:uncharacterized repeat protein (TIGR01451 family)
LDHQSIAVLTTASPSNQTRDFGYRGPGEIGDTVFLDVNNNGVVDPGEGIANVVVTLVGDFDADNLAETVTTTTDADGFYQFNGLRVSPGGVVYTVNVIPISIPTGLSPSFDPDGARDNRAIANLTTTSPSDQTRDFGYRGLGTIGDTVFLDVNNNNAADAGEGITNVTVTLTGDFDGDGSEETVSTLTDANGRYQFGGLRTTSASVAFTVAVSTATLPLGLSPSFDPDSARDNRAVAILNTAASSDQTRDFGYRGAGTIGDTVFLDANNNNLPDPGEGISNAIVTLSGDLDADGVDEFLMATTDANGSYLFSGLRTSAAGVVYSVVVASGTLPAGLTQSFDPDSVRDNRSVATLTNATPSDQSRDFGYRGLGVIGDTVFLDVANPGVADPGEGLSLVTVTLTGDLDADGVDETVTTTTDAVGAYQFSGLRTTTVGVAYTIVVGATTLPVGLSQSFDPDATLDNRSIATLTNAAPSDLTRDFGYRGLGSIGDTVFLDINNNNAPDPGEGIANVVVTLAGDHDADGVIEALTATIDTDGLYQFIGLRTSAIGVSYTASVNVATLPAGLSQSFDPDGVRDHRAAATLRNTAPSNQSRDFGYRAPGVIGDVVFLDVNNNNVADAGEGISNVTVALTGDLDGDGANETIGTTSTSGGLYQFSGLRTTLSGVSYTVAVNAATLPAGVTQSFDPDGTSDNRSVVTLTSIAMSNLTRDFGYRGAGSIGDMVFLDVNNNGIADAGEGITNVTVSLTGDLDGDGVNETVNTRTDANGGYQFGGLRTSASGLAYTVAVTTATLPSGILPSFDSDGTLDNRSVATLSNAAPSIQTRDFGYRGAGTIGDTVFLDSNNNGLADPGEGLANVVVTLVGDHDADGMDETIATATTDTDGRYLFGGLRTSTVGVAYTAVVNVATVPAGLSPSFDIDGVRDNRTSVTLTNGAPTDVTCDFGYRGPGVIGDSLFVDLNNNNNADPGEGIANVKVSLTGDLDADGDDETFTAITDTDGSYLFTGLRTALAGVPYTIAIVGNTLPAGLNQTFDPDGTLDNRSSALLTDAASSNRTRDFGYRGVGSVGDTIFLDVNNNNVADSGEGIAGVTVTLTGDLDGDGANESVSTTSNSDGAYLFLGLRTTTGGLAYTVAVDTTTLPAGVAPSFDPDGTRDHRAIATLSNASPNDLNRDFGYRGPGSIGDVVFLDVNQNGVADPGEGISNVAVTLTGDLDGDGVNETVVTATDANGSFLFGGLRTTAVGVSYSIVVNTASLPTGITQSSDPDSTRDSRATATLTDSAPSNLTRDFGYRGTGAIGDSIFVDLNGNNVADPGEGIADVVVTLTGDHDGDGIVETLTTTTNTDGAYSFSGLSTSAAGIAYVVQIQTSSLPVGLAPSQDPDGVRDSRGSATLTNAAPEIQALDFGYTGPGVVGDVVFLDVNNNNAADPGEGIANVLVQLTGDMDGDGANETVTALTDANGLYQFRGLRITAGGVTYTVAIDSATLPAGVLPSFDPDGTRDHRSVATLSNGAPNNLTRDFGYRGVGSIGDSVFVDLNNNNAADPGEGIANVSITLVGDLDADGVDDTVTTTTDTDGLYLFSGLRTSTAGVSYSVVVNASVLTSGLEQSYDPDSTRDNRSTATLTDGSPINLTRDFGYRGTGSIGDTVFLDIDNNGTANPGEGLGSVVVSLTGDLDGDGTDETVTTTTDTNGRFQFSGLRTPTTAVSYQVVVVASSLPSGLAPSFDPDGIRDNRSIATLTSAAPSDQTRDFGYRGLGVVGDTVFLDIDNNGSAGPGEGISNARVTLTGDLDGDGADETVSTTTDANGNYLFTGMRTTSAGVSYVVTVDSATLAAGLAPSFDPDGTCDNQSIATLASDSPTNLTRDFGYRGAGSIGESIFVDLNNNGVADPGEGIANVTVTLTGDIDGDGVDESFAVTTDTNGVYLFSGLRTSTAGVAYSLVVNANTLPAGLAQSFDPNGTRDNRSTATLTNNSPTNLSSDFGYRGTGVVGDTVFMDVNNNGLADPGEGLANVMLTLIGDLDGDGSNETVETTSTAGGLYQFSGLRVVPAGIAYTLAVNTTTLPSGVVPSFDADGTQDNRSIVTLNSAAISDLSRDFGYRGAGVIGDTVFLDVNNNGVADPGEGISNATITLTGDVNGDGVNETFATTTDANGAYLFSGLRTSSVGVAYTVAVTVTTDSDGAYSFGGLRTTAAGVGYAIVVNTGTLPTGLSPSFDPDGTRDNRTVVTLTNATPGAPARNFGYRGQGSIGDSVFLDVNNNGLADTGEGILNVTVTLTGDLDGDGADETVATTTGADGRFQFSGLRTPADSVPYRVVVVPATLPPGLTQSFDPDGIRDSQSIANLSGASPSDQTRDFGYRGAGSIGDTIFLDVNNNGLADPGEGLTNVVVSLTGDLNGDGADETVTTRTDGAGAFLFSGLRTNSAGVAYRIDVSTNTLPAGLVQSHDPDSVRDHRGTATLTDSAPSNLTRDFGYRGLGSVSSTVFMDINNNGVADPGEGIPGATVTLTGDLDGDGVDETVTTTRGPGGVYQFSGLRTSAAGVPYTVAVATPSLPLGVNPSFDPDGVRDNRSRIELSTAAPGDTSRRFGYRGSGVVGDAIFQDINGNGSIDAGEGIAGATVTLMGDVNGDGAEETFATTTDADGVYQFTGLRTLANGLAYSITVDSASLPIGLLPSFDPDGVRDHRAMATLSDSAPSDLSRDFGYRGPVDLRVSMRSSQTELAVSQPVTQTFEVSNGGPFATIGARVVHVVPAGLTFVSASPGVVYDPVQRTITYVTDKLDPSSSATFTASFVVNSQATPTMTSSVTVTPPDGVVDPALANNTASFQNRVIFEADLSITKTSGGGVYQAGGTQNYTIVVRNRSNQRVSDIRVRDALSPAVVSAAWTAVLSPGSAGKTEGVGGIDEVIELAGGGPAIYTLRTVIGTNSDGRLVNTAQVIPPPGLTDPVPSNNSAQEIARSPIVVSATEIGCLSAPLINVIDPFTGEVKRQISLYEPNFRGGVRVAVGDVDGDGIDEIVAAPGPGRVGEIRVFEQDGAELVEFRTLPFGSAYRNGVEVAVGDIDGDGDDDLVAAASRGPGDVNVYRVNPGQPKPVDRVPFKSFRAFNSNFLGGATVAVADVGKFANGTMVNSGIPDGVMEIVVGTGPGTRATVSVFDVSGTPRVVRSLLPMSSDYRNGVSVSAARINADAIDDIVVSAGSGGGTLRETYIGRIDAGPNALLRRDAVFAEIAGTSPPLFSAPVDLDGDQIADRFFQILGEQGTQTNPGIRVTGANGGPILQSLTQLNYSQRIAASRVGKAPNRTYAASGLSFEDLQVGTGATPAANGNVVVRFVASRMTGGVLAENLSAPQAISLRLDSFDAPSGLRNALASMRVGGIRRIMLPSGLQAGPLPGIGSTTAAVVLEIELVATTA